LNFFKIEI